LKEGEEANRSGKELEAVRAKREEGGKTGYRLHPGSVEKESVGLYKYPSPRGIGKEAKRAAQTVTQNSARLGRSNKG
jgi:hypothetical protein